MAGATQGAVVHVDRDCEEATVVRIPRRLILNEMLAAMDLTIHGSGCDTDSSGSFVSWLKVDLPRRRGENRLQSQVFLVADLLPSLLLMRASLTRHFFIFATTTIWLSMTILWSTLYGHNTCFSDSRASAGVRISA